MRIIGIDPALTKTGWGIIENINNSLKFVACGTIKTNNKDELPVRLNKIHKELIEAISLYKPKVAAIEETFINNNPLSSLKLGHARGCIILTLAICKIPVVEYSATAIKKSIVGVGRAEKQQIQSMVNILLPQSKNYIKTEDEADALATAICYINNKKFY